MTTLETSIARLVEKGLITQEQADVILAKE